MTEIGGLKQYRVASTLSILLLASLFAFGPASVRAQDCERAKQRIFHIETESRQVPDSLQTLLDLAVFVRECQNKVSLELELPMAMRKVQRVIWQLRAAVAVSISFIGSVPQPDHTQTGLHSTCWVNE